MGALACVEDGHDRERCARRRVEVMTEEKAAHTCACMRGDDGKGGVHAALHAKHGGGLGALDGPHHRAQPT